jgi:hypothetical protein
MSEIPRVGAFAIVPSNDLAAAIPFWERLGFARKGGDANYIILTGWGCEVHLTQAGAGPWRVPEENNPFGVFIRTPDVDAIAARAAGYAEFVSAPSRHLAQKPGVSASSMRRHFPSPD